MPWNKNSFFIGTAGRRKKQYLFQIFNGVVRRYRISKDSYRIEPHLKDDTKIIKEIVVQENDEKINKLIRALRDGRHPL